MSAIFISHSNRDGAAAVELRQRLADRGYCSVFLDFDPELGIPAGRDWEQELYHQLRTCHAVIVLCSRHSMASRWCFAEIVHAKSLGKHVFPARLDDCEIHAVLTTRQVLDLSGDREQAYARLWRGLEDAGLDEVFPWDRSRPPYPGLLAFEEGDAAIFFGRGAEIRRGLETLERLRRFGGARAVVVLGASGTGKSSLFRAGLLPRLRKSSDWLVLPPFRPGGQPWRELALAFSRAFAEHGDEPDWRQIRSELTRADLVPGRAARALVERAIDLRQAAGRPGATVLVAIDQLEELLAGDGNGGQSFLAALSGALETPETPLMVLSTLRSDLLERLQHHPAGRNFDFADLPLGPLTPEGLLEVVEGPARLHDLEVEDGLAEAMAADARTADALPLLAFTLRELYERYGADGRLEISEYRQELGGLDGSVARAAESVLAESPLAVEEGRELRDAFLAMVRIDDQGSFARHPACWDDLPVKARPRLERFVAARLLVDRGEGTERRLEVAHEALFRSWETLRRWLDRDRELLLWRRRLGVAHREWERTRRDRRALLSGPALEEARGWSEHSSGRLAPDEQAYLEESFREASRRRRRRVLALAGSLALLLTAAVAGLTLWRRAEAARARAQDVTRVAVAGEWLARDPTKAALVLLEVERPEETPLATAKLRQALAHGLSELELRGHGAGLSYAAFADGGERIVTASRDGSARIWNPGGDFVELPAHRDNVVRAELSPDGARVLTLTERGALRVIRSDGRGDPVRLGDRRTAAVSARFGPRGERIVTTSRDGTVRLWSADGTGSPLELAPPGGVVEGGVCFTPQGDRLLTVSTEGAIQLWSGGDPQTVAEAPADLLFAAFSPHADRFFAVTAGGRGAMGFLVGRHDPVVLDALADESPLAVSFTAEGDRLASVAADAVTVRVRRIDATAAEGVSLSGHEGEVSAAAFGPAGRRLVTGATDGTARVWDLATGGSLVLRGHEGPVVWVAFDPTGRRVVTAADDGTARVWPARPASATVVLRGHQGPVVAATFGPRGERVVTASLDGTARVWNADGLGQAIALRGHERRVSSARFDARGERVLTASEDGTARIWRADGGGKAVVLGGHDGGVESAAFSPQGDRVVTGSATGEVRVWVWGTDGTEALRLEGHRDRVMDAAFSPDGKRLLTASLDRTARVWRVDGAGATALLEGHEGAILAASLGPRGERVATASADRTARVWRVDGTEVAVLRGHDNDVVEARFDPSGRRVVTASNDATVRIWNADGSGRPVVLEGHSERVTAVSFSPGGRRVVSASGDGTARVWWVDGSRPPLVLQGHGERVTSASFSPDGARVLTASEDGTARVWTIAAADLQRAIAAAVKTCLEPDFRRSYLGESAAQAARAHEECRRP